MPFVYKIDVPKSRQARKNLSLYATRAKRFEDAWLYRPNQPLTSEELAKFSTRVEFTFSDVEANALLDFLTLGSDLVVSNRVVEIVETLDPGRHQFIELEIMNMPKAIKKRDLKFYLVNCCLYLDFVDKDGSKLVNEYQDSPKLRPSYRAAFNHEVLALPGWRPSAHVWYDLRWLKYALFISEELKQRLDAIDAAPVSYFPVRLA